MTTWLATAGLPSSASPTRIRSWVSPLPVHTASTSPGAAAKPLMMFLLCSPWPRCGLLVSRGRSRPADTGPGWGGPAVPAAAGRSAVVAEGGLGQGARVVLEQPPPVAAPVHHRPGAVGQRPEDGEQLLGQAEQHGHAQPERGAVADHHHEITGRGRVGDPLQRATRTLRDGERGLALGRGPGRVLSRVALADLAVVEALQQAAG